jgi:acyl-CoA thioester hydrolase
MNKIDYIYSLEFAVRDYECDLQGIVNNACYFHYFEHARHQYLIKNGMDFAELHKQGINPVVVRAELDYKFPLMSGDIFIARLSVEKRSRIRILFYQDIVRLPDKKLICKAVFHIAVLKQGKPVKTDIILPYIYHFST